MGESNNEDILCLVELNWFANRCGFFFNAVIEQNFTCNNGYNCRHTEQEETELNEDTSKEVGMCYGWSCPMAISVDKEALVKCALDPDEWDETDYVLVYLKTLNGLGITHAHPGIIASYSV